MVTNMQSKNEAKAFARATRTVVAAVDEAMVAGLAVNRAHRGYRKANNERSIAKWLYDCNDGTDNGEYAKAQDMLCNWEARFIVEKRCFARACKALRDAINGDAVRRAAVVELLKREAEVSPMHHQIAWVIDLG